MLQKQYFNTKLKNKHINDILDVYKIKYSGIKNEIESKVNQMIKLFQKDISSFLENTEKIALTKNKLNNYEKMKTELESIRNKLKQKTHNENKIKYELELLSQENSMLKVKIKSLNKKLYDLNNSSNANLRSSYKSPLMNSLRKSNLNNLNNDSIYNRASIKYNKKYIPNIRKKTSNSMDQKALIENSINKLDLSLTSKFDYSSRVLESVEKSNSKKRKRKIKTRKQPKLNYISLNRTSIKSTLRPVSNLKEQNSNIKKKNKLKKFINNKEKDENINKTYIKKTTNKKNKVKICTPFTPFQQTSINNSPENSKDISCENNIEYDDIEKGINSVFEQELKQLDQDEEIIKKLLEKANNGNDDNCTDFNLNENNLNDIDGNKELKL